jgi:hypothetical protein
MPLARGGLAPTLRACQRRLCYRQGHLAGKLIDLRGVHDVKPVCSK